jgi:lipoprotein-releasing system permease protein
MRFSTFVALKYFRAKRKTGFISIITYVSIFGVTIGVVALVIVLSIFNGFETEVRSRLISSDAHIRFRKFWNEPIANYAELRDELLRFENVAGVSPAIRKEALLMGRRRQSVIIKGIDPNTAGDVTNINRSIIMGSLDLGSQKYRDRTIPGIVLGKELAMQTMALDIGDTVLVMAIPANASIFSQPAFKEFMVTGISEIGFYEYDKVMAYVSMSAAQELFDLGDETMWMEIKLDHYDQAGAVADSLEGSFGYPYIADTWYEQQKTLYNWLELEKLLYFALMSLIILVAAFNIVSSLIMIVMEKTREIGILKGMGATPKMIRRIFVTEGLVIGIIGTVLGLFAGFTILYLQQEFGLLKLPGDIFYISVVPVDMQILDFVLVALASVFLCFIAAVYPAAKAARLNPVEAIRYE